MKKWQKMVLKIWANFAQMPKIRPRNYQFEDKTAVPSTIIAVLRIQRAVVLQLMSIKDIQGLRFTKGWASFQRLKG